MNTHETTITLGDEHDDQLRRVIEDVLCEFGAKEGGRARGLGGSQDIEILELEIDGQRLVVETETYIGLSIRGASELVRRIESEVKTRMAPKSP